MKKIVVLGGGISGLTTAFQLSKNPHLKNSKIFVLEKSCRFGGWLHTTRYKDGSSFEHGPRSIRPKGIKGWEALKLVEDLGLSSEVLKSHPSAKNRYLYVNKKLHKLSPWCILQTKSPFTHPLIKSLISDITSRKKELKSDQSIHSLIEERLGKEVADYAISALFRGIYANDTKQLSAYTCAKELYEAVEREGSIVLGMLKNMSPKKEKEQKFLKERGGPLIQKAIDEKWASFTLKNGTQQVTDKLVEELTNAPNVEVRGNAPCQKLDFKDKGLHVVTDNDLIEADYIVSTISSLDLADILPPTHTELSELLKKIKAVTCVVVNLEFPGKQPIPEGFGHLLPAKEDGPVLGVVYDSCVFPEHDRKDQASTRLTLMLGGYWFDELKQRVGSVDETTLSSFATSVIKEQLNIHDEPTKVIVSIQKDCIPHYEVEHSVKVKDIRQYLLDRDIPMTVLGSSYDGAAVTDCILFAVDGAHTIAERLLLNNRTD